MQWLALVKDDIAVTFAISACLGVNHRKTVQSFQKNSWEGFRILPCTPRLYKFMDKTVAVRKSFGVL